MKAIIDTSSLLVFVKYYLPFDTNNQLTSFLKDKIENGEIVVLDKVLEEAKYLQKRIILEKLDFLYQSKKIVNTTELIPNKQFFHWLNHDFCNKEILEKKGIDNTAFENAKETYLKKDADPKLILYALRIKSDKLIPFVITEETGVTNDNKIFKKIPLCCQSAGIECLTLPDFFKQKYNLNLGKLLQ